MRQALVGLPLELRAGRQVALEAHRVPDQPGKLFKHLGLQGLVGCRGARELCVLPLLLPPSVLELLRLVLLLLRRDLRLLLFFLLGDFPPYPLFFFVLLFLLLLPPN